MLDRSKLNEAKEKYLSPEIKAILKKTVYSSDGLITAYLDWYNDFLSVSRYAQKNHISESEAELLINAGRKYYNYIYN